MSERFSRHFEFDGPERPHKREGPPKVYQELKILKFLKLVPWILLITFAISFFWDFEGRTITLFNLTLPLNGLLRIVSVSGLIGFLTNWVAITMLFRPVRRRPLLGQGLIPAHKERIAWRLSTAVSEDLINPDLIKQKLDDSGAVSRYRSAMIDDIESVIRKPAFRKDVKEWLMDYLQDLVREPKVKSSLTRQITEEIEKGLKEKPIERTALKTYMLIRGKTLTDLIADAVDDIPITLERKIDVVDDLLDELPEAIRENTNQLDATVTGLVYTLVNRFDVQALVEENLQKYDEARLEKMIRNATNEQLRTIQYLGAVLGTVGGFVIWQPVYMLILLSAIGVTIWTVDSWLYREKPTQ
ncbi:MAG: DUF445 family protein [Balneolaceae bacterium]|nr:DUF445 family protein [Balneolaceae bacterium]